MKIYQNKNIEQRLESYFSPNYIGKQWCDIYKEMVIKRKNLIKWPLVNYDIISLASLNEKIRIIKLMNKNNKSV